MTKTFYKIENGQAQVGSGTFVPESFIEYIVGQEPVELIEALSKESIVQDLTTRIAEAKQYLSDTSWIWEKYNRNVLVLKDLTDAEFQTKYQDIILAQEEARLNINKYEQELLALNMKGAI